MNASHFFKEEINDNNYQGVFIKNRLSLNENFNCNTYYSKNKPKLRKEGIEDFLRKIKDNKNVDNSEILPATISHIVFIRSLSTFLILPLNILCFTVRDLYFTV